MRKICLWLILLTLIPPGVFADEVIHYSGKLQVGGVAFIPDSITFIVLGNGDSIDAKAVTSGFVADSIWESDSGAYSDYGHLVVKWLIYDDSVFGSSAYTAYQGIRQIWPALNVGTPGGDSTVRVYAYAYDPQSNPQSGAKLVAKLMGRFVQDTCNQKLLIDYEVESEASGSDGYVYLDLVKSKCLSGYNKYKIGLMYNRHTDYFFMDTIPGDSATYRITR